MRNTKIKHPNMARWGKKNPKWAGGISRDFSRLKKGLRVGKLSFIHHLDGDPENNKESNLKVLKRKNKKSKTNRLHELLTKRASKK
ncbi:MAG: hypothetical protein WC679_13610 [Bacteroidales bacterium]|jgi:hypothetical protein